MTIVRCNQCGGTLKKIYYHNYKITDAGYSRKIPIHLANLYHCKKESVIYQRQDNKGLIPVVDLNDTLPKKIIPELEEIE